MVIVLVAVVIVSIVAVAVFRTVRGHRDALRRAQWKVQAERLADAAIDRAILRLRGDATYRGETWRPTVDGVASSSSSGSDAAVAVPAMQANIVVQVKQATATIEITADVPNDPAHRVRVFRTVTVEIPPPT